LVLTAKNPIDVTRRPETIAKKLITLRGATRDARGIKVVATRAVTIPITAKISRSLIKDP
jgi:hypothetical protein